MIIHTILAVSAEAMEYIEVNLDWLFAKLRAAIGDEAGPPLGTRSAFAGFRTGSGQTHFLHKCNGYHSCCSVFLFWNTYMLSHIPHYFVTHTMHFATYTVHFIMKLDYGKLRHFCGGPVCPDPVWKLSRNALPASR